ncbi:MAG: YbbR-like domain-containing protein [Parabacteroides sp.]|nr:YbbR-like domain-containing protein [Parabacteroides sp.]
MFEKKNIHALLLRTFEKIKSYLHAKNGREFLIFLFFVFVSFSFWLLQVLNDDYETELTIPLKIKNVPENVVLTSELPEKLSIGVKDRGTVLVNYIWGQTFYPITLDFADYSDKGHQVRIPSTTLSKRVSGQLNQSTQLSSIKPDTLELIYAEGKAKKVPVKLRGNITAERQFYIADTIFSPDSVMVYAPQSILDTISAAYTQLVNLEQVSDTTRSRINFHTIKGARFTPSYSDVTFLVDVFSEKTVEVPVVGINFPKDKVLRTFPPKIQVSFQVGLSHFREVSADDFVVVVNFEELNENKSEKCKPELTKFPEHVKHIRLNPGEMDYIIEQKIDFND